MKLWIAKPPATRPPEIKKILNDSRIKERKAHAGYSAKSATLAIMKKRGIGATDPESFYKHFIVTGGGLAAVRAYRDTLVQRGLAAQERHPEKRVNWLDVPIREGSRLIDFLK
jgi:hypothetical protein